MKPISEALGEVLSAFGPRGVERVSLLEAAGRVLAVAPRARVDLPPFDNSAMDGYAVRAADVVGASEGSPVTLPVCGESRAGGGAPDALPAGSAMRIFTGAVMPAGADAVIMQEDTTREGDAVAVRIAPSAGRHVRHRASDLAAGAELCAGVVLGPGELGLLASQHHAQVSVYRRPRVAILSTGDELIEVSDSPQPGKIVNSNAYALAAQVREAGGDPWILPNCGDRLEAIVELVRAGLSADVLLSVGGVSVGEYDLMGQAFQQAGVSQGFWKVAIKPGKPLSFGVKDGVPVIGLPGNPVSAMVTFEVFVRPGVRRMLGDPRPFRSHGTVRLAHAHSHRTGRTELARARLDGARVADLRRLQGSGSLPSMVGVDAYVVLDANRAEFPEGAELPAIFVREQHGSPTHPFGG